jgi:hypothetical protein
LYTTLYNYADDNTLSYGHPDFNVLTSILELESNVLINWFKVNKMQANPDKFQVLAVGKKTFDKNKRSALSCTFSNFFEFLSVQKCQAKGKKLKLLRMKVWNIVNLLNLSKYRPKRLSIFSCCDAFLQIELI